MKLNKLTTAIALILSGQASLLLAEPLAADDREPETLVVVGNRVESDSQTYVGSIGALNEDELATDANLIATLGDIPGVNVGSDLGRSIGQQYNIRGFSEDERVIILQNGIPRSASLFSGQMSSFRTDTSLLKRVEVVKGSSSILYGSGAIGGVVSMDLKDARDFLEGDQQFGGMIGSRHESNNMHSIRGAIYGTSENEAVDFVLYRKEAQYGNIELADGGTTAYQEVDNDEQVTTSYLNMGWNLTDEQRLAFSFYQYENDVDTAWNALSNVDQSSSSTTGTLKQTDYNIDYSYTPWDNEWIDLKVRAYYSEGTYDRTRRPVYELDYENEEQRHGFTVQNVSTFESGAISHTLITGVDFHHREEDATYYYNGEYDDFGSMPNEYNDWGLYAQDIMQLGKWELSLGARYDVFDREVTDKDTGGYDGDAFSPRVAVSYEVTEGLHLLSGYSVAFRAPTPHETSSEGPLNDWYWYLANPDLKPETAHELEVGASFAKSGLFNKGDHLKAKFTYFDANIDDMITLVELTEMGASPDDSIYVTYANVEEAKRKGYEFSSTYYLSAWDLSASYEHLDLYDKQTKQKITPFADKLRLAVGYTFEAIALSLSANVDHWFKPEQNPESYMWGTTEYFYVDEAYTQANIAGKWIPNNNGLESTTLHFGINNIFDEQYINAQDTTTTSRVGKATNYYVDLEVKF